MIAADTRVPERFGRYRVIRLLGQGGMGQVLLAHDPQLERDVAIKWLRPDLELPPDQRAALLTRMRHEARACARVSHANLVALYDMGETDELGLYLILEYVDGPTLEQRLEGGPLDRPAVAQLALAIGGALSAVHRAGVLHRDVKPENVILTATLPKLTDFGIARVPESTLTRDGRVLGTPAYCAPEAITDGTFSPASDQFSMAATVWEALTGRRAFPGTDTVAVAHRITAEPPPRATEADALDGEVDAVFARALAKQPAGRFPSCEDFGLALARAIGTPPRCRLQTLPDQLHSRAARRRRTRNVLQVAGLGMLAGLLLATAGAQLLQRLSDTPAADGPAPRELLPARRTTFVRQTPSPDDSRLERASPPDPRASHAAHDQSDEVSSRVDTGPRTMTDAAVP